MLSHSHSHLYLPSGQLQRNSQTNIFMQFSVSRATCSVHFTLLVLITLTAIRQLFNKYVSLVNTCHIVGTVHFYKYWAPAVS